MSLSSASVLCPAVTLAAAGERRQWERGARSGRAAVRPVSPRIGELSKSLLHNKKTTQYLGDTFPTELA
jgi:hypothetical protein